MCETLGSIISSYCLVFILQAGDMQGRDSGNDRNTTAMSRNSEGSQQRCVELDRLYLAYELTNSYPSYLSLTIAVPDGSKF